MAASKQEFPGRTAIEDAKISGSKLYEGIFVALISIELTYQVWNTLSVIKSHTIPTIDYFLRHTFHSMFLSKTPSRSSKLSITLYLNPC